MQKDAKPDTGEQMMASQRARRQSFETDKGVTGGGGKTRIHKKEVTICNHLCMCISISIFIYNSVHIHVYHKYT